MRKVFALMDGRNRFWNGTLFVDSLTDECLYPDGPESLQVLHDKARSIEGKASRQDVKLFIVTLSILRVTPAHEPRFANNGKG